MTGHGGLPLPDTTGLQGLQPVPEQEGASARDDPGGDGRPKSPHRLRGQEQVGPQRQGAPRMRIRVPSRLTFTFFERDIRNKIQRRRDAAIAQRPLGFRDADACRILRPYLRRREAAAALIEEHRPKQASQRLP